MDLFQHSSQTFNTAILANCLSDQCSVMMCMPSQNIKIACNKSYRSFREARIKSFSKALTLIYISTILKETNPNEAYQILKNPFMAKFEFFFPYKSQAKTKVVKAGLILNYKSY